MNSTSGFISRVSDLIEGMRDAGFSDGNIATLVSTLPNRRFSDPHKGLLRKLYLVHIGLAEFTLKQPGTVRMYSSEKYWDDEMREFQTPYHHKIHPDDEKYMWNMEFDLSKLTLHPAIPPNRHKKQITLKSALTSFQKSVPENLRANYWHGMWLHLHQEFIPEYWKGLLRDKDGRIIFPGVRLIRKRDQEDDLEIIQFPHMKTGSGGYNIDYDLDLQTKYGSFDETVRKNDHFACFRE